MADVSHAITGLCQQKTSMDSDIEMEGVGRSMMEAGGGCNSVSGAQGEDARKSLEKEGGKCMCEGGIEDDPEAPAAKWSCVGPV